MVLINNINIEVKEWDTIDTFKKRIAMTFNTLEKYLVFQKELDIYSATTSNQIVIDLLKEIKNVNNFNEFWEKNSKYLDISKFSEYFELYITFNTKLNDSLKKTPVELAVLVLEEQKAKIEEKYSVAINLNITNVWANRKLFRKNNEKDIATNGIFLETFDKIDAESMTTTQFNIDRKIFEVIINTEKFDIYDVFNSIKVNNQIPLVYLNEYYKFMKSFDFNTDEIKVENIKEEDLKDVIIFKLLKKSKSVLFSDILLTFFDNKIKISFDVLVDENIDEQLDLVLEMLKTNREQIVSIEDKVITGDFMIPNQTLNKYVFSDLIFLNNIFKNLGINTLESQYVTIKKSNYYLYFDIPGIKLIKVNLTEREVTRKLWSTMSEKARKKFKIGSSYIYVKVLSAKNFNEVNVFQNIIKKIFVIYNNEYSNIVKFYSKYIPDFENEYKDKDLKSTKIKKDKKIKLTGIDGDIFVKGYGVKCESKRQPVSYTEKEFDEKYPDGLDENLVITYPKKSQLKPGKIQRKYVCLDKGDYKYPGLLKKNTLSNKNDYSHLPCCFIKEKIRWDEYYNEEDKEEEIIQQRLITTDKILDNDVEGKIPDELSKLFSIFVKDTKIQFIRKGVYIGPSSFLNCVMEARGLTSNEDGTVKTKEEIFNLIQNYRNKFLDDNYIALCKQQLYDIDLVDIQKMIKDKDVYFDPKLFKHIIEKEFNINVLIFSRIDENNIDLVLPRYKHFYTNFFSKNDTIIIYEHYNHCEIILKVNKKNKNKVNYTFDYELDISKELRNIYNNLHQFYKFNDRINNPVVQREITDLLVSQKVDSSGKTRCIKILFNGQILNLITTPLPQFFVKIEENTFDEYIKDKPSLNLVFSFITSVLKISYDNILKITNFVGDITALKFSQNNINYEIPVKNSGNIPQTIALESNIELERNNNSIFSNFNTLKRFSKHIVQYFIILYSKFLQENNIDINFINDDNVIEDFITKNISVNPTHDYGNFYLPIKVFIQQSQIFSPDLKLILKSVETRKRLTYILKRNIRENELKVYLAYNQKFLENYYDDVDSFRNENTEQIIIKSIQNVEKWNNDKLINNMVGSCPSSNKRFLYNEKIDRNIYLVQEVSNLYEFLGNSKIWKTKNINSLKNIENKGKKLINKDEDKFVIVFSNYECNKIFVRLANKTSKDRISPNKLFVIGNSSKSPVVRYFSLLSF